MGFENRRNAPLVEEQPKSHGTSSRQSICAQDCRYNLARFSPGFSVVFVFYVCQRFRRAGRVQEADRRAAFKFFAVPRRDSRAGLMRIVRNAFYDWLNRTAAEEKKKGVRRRTS